MSRLFDPPPKPSPKAKAAEVDTCPVHWNNVPILPNGPHPKQDRDGYGSLYRHKHLDQWWLIKYLPPFDGRVSAMGTVNKCFSSLEAFKRYVEKGR